MSSTFQIAFVAVCAGQNHLTVDATIQGVGTKRLTFEAAEITDPLNAEDDGRRIIRDLIRMHLRGLTLSQAKAEMQAGFTITI